MVDLQSVSSFSRLGIPDGRSSTRKSGAQTVWSLVPQLTVVCYCRISYLLRAVSGTSAKTLRGVEASRAIPTKINSLRPACRTVSGTFNASYHALQLGHGADSPHQIKRLLNCHHISGLGTLLSHCHSVRLSTVYRLKPGCSQKNLTPLGTSSEVVKQAARECSRRKEFCKTLARTIPQGYIILI